MHPLLYVPLVFPSTPTLGSVLKLAVLHSHFVLRTPQRSVQLDLHMDKRLIAISAQMIAV